MKINLATTTIMIIASFGICQLKLQASDLQRSGDQLLDELIERHSGTKKISGTFHIDYGNDKSYERSVGNANDEFSIKNSKNSRFLIASITKNYVAAAILRLQELGKIDIEDPLVKFFPELSAESLSGEDGTQVQIKHLLNHTSGIGDIYSTPEIEKMEYSISFGIGEIINVLKKKALITIPGEKFEYSNTGYILLGELIRRITGKSYREFAQSELFAKADLKETTVGFPFGKEPIVATTYEREGQVRTPFMQRFNINHLHTGDVFTDGNHYSTARDVAKWVRKLTGGKVISRSSLDQMFAPSAPEYGFGWRVPKFGGGDIIWHGGYYTGYASLVMHSLSTGITVVALTNQPEEPLREDVLLTFYKICSSKSTD